ncbi:ABC transporter ATP-binding protein [Flavisolibacter sp. BT320]|nr:ABC transporter ATP-binding protein [Flavisolibacter longurius]
MAKTVIKVDNLSKQYRLGAVSSGSINHDLNRWWHKVRGKEDPYLKIGETNDRTKRGVSEYIWALQDVNFEVKQGEVLGIIGRNGAGKSTLLKILSRTTAPTTGKLRMKGRIASLLEVGTGFHPELTGRENVYLNGAILGMSRAEINRKFDEIVDFAGVERYIDTPVKRYSSGMYVRLAFAVAAFLEPEILIVDEVLAVGDIEFQKKCLGRMQDVSVNDGRTILFVSHNLNAIQKLCLKCIYLEQGKLIVQDQTEKVLKTYLSKAKKLEYFATDLKLNNDVFVKQASVDNRITLENGLVYFDLIVVSKSTCKVSIDLRISSTISIPVAFSSIGTLNYEDLVHLKVGENRISFFLDAKLLAVGEYNVSIDVTVPNVKYFDRCDDCLSFEVLNSEDDDRKLNQMWNLGYVQLPIEQYAIQ